MLLYTLHFAGDNDETAVEYDLTPTEAFHAIECWRAAGWRLVDGSSVVIEEV